MEQHGIFKAFLDGVKERGVGGFVYVRDDKCCYMFPNELQHALARKNMTELLGKQEAHKMCYVMTQDDEGLHLVVYPNPTEEDRSAHREPHAGELTVAVAADEVTAMDIDAPP